MRLDPTTYHRWRFEAALMVYQEAEAAPVEHLAAWDKGVWFRADTFLAAGGYECGEEPLTIEPSADDWRAAVGQTQDFTSFQEISRRAHELARQRSQK